MGQTIAFASFIVAVGLTADIDKGIVDRMRSLPINPAVGAGRAQHLQPAALQHRHRGDVADRPADRLADPQRRRRRGARPTLLLLMWGFAMIWVGILVGSAMRSVEAVNGLMFTTMFPITFLANTFAPTESMPGGCAPSPSGTRSPRWSRRCASCGATTGAGAGRRGAAAAVPGAITIIWTIAITAVVAPAGAAGLPAPHRRLTRPAASGAG